MASVERSACNPQRQHTESDIHQDRVLSNVFSNYGLSADIPTHCTDNYNIRQNVKYEHEPPEITKEDNACSHQIEGVDGHLTKGLQTATYGHLHHETTERNVIRSFENSSQETTSAQCDSELIEVKQKIKSDHEGYGANTDLTRYWVTSAGGILKEVKAEHKPCVSVILPDEDCGENDDQIEHVQNGKTQSNIQNNQISLKPSSNSPSGSKGVKPFIFDMAIVDSSHLKIIERRHTCDTCWRSFVYVGELKINVRKYTCVKPFTCATCGKSLGNTSSLKVYERIHTGVKHFTCITCEKSFVSSSNLKMHES